MFLHDIVRLGLPQILQVYFREHSHPPSDCLVQRKLELSSLLAYLRVPPQILKPLLEPCLGFSLSDVGTPSIYLLEAGKRQKLKAFSQLLLFVTFRDLQKIVESQPAAANQQQLQRLKGKPFWIWEPVHHRSTNARYKGQCCSAHILGLCKKDGVEKPFYDYEKLVYRALFEPGFLNSSSALPTYDPANVLCPFKEKHLWIKKATGLGITEFILRVMAWLCFKDDSYKNSQMVIVTGPNIELAIKLIKRMKGLFLEKLGVTINSKETVSN
jgi:hypothetical protein